MTAVSPIKPTKLPEGKQIGVICQTMAEQAKSLLDIANSYASTNDPALCEVSKVLYAAAHHVASGVEFMGKNINGIAEKYAKQMQTPQPPAA